MRRAADFVIGPCEWIIYNSRFMLIPLFIAVLYKLGWFILDGVRVAFGWKYVEILEADTLDILVMIDAMMVATVAYLIVTGSYLIYVKDRLYNFVNRDEDSRPSALNHLDPNILKKFIGGSLVTISSIKLIRMVLEGEAVSTNLWVMLVVFHLAFLLSVYVFAKVSLGHAPTDKKESSHHA